MASESFGVLTGLHCNSRLILTFKSFTQELWAFTIAGSVYFERANSLESSLAAEHSARNWGLVLIHFQFGRLIFMAYLSK